MILLNPKFSNINKIKLLVQSMALTRVTKKLMMSLMATVKADFCSIKQKNCGKKNYIFVERESKREEMGNFFFFYVFTNREKRENMNGNKK